MQTLNIGAAPAPQQQQTGSNTNTQQPSRVVKFAVPYVGNVRPVVGRMAKVLVYKTSLGVNSRGEPIFGCAIMGTEPVGPHHKHSTSGEEPSIKEGRILRIWPAREEGGLEFVTIEAETAPENPNKPPTVTPSAKGLGVQLQGVRNDITDLEKAAVAADYDAVIGILTGLEQRIQAARAYTQRLQNPA